VSLVKLLTLWAKSPSAEVAELVAAASALERTHLPKLRGRTRAALTTWEACGRQPRPQDVPALLEALPDVLWRDAHARLLHVARWPADPRVDDAMVRLLETLPYRSTSKPFYTQVIAQAQRVADPALFARLQRARAAICEAMSPTLGDWLERRVDELLAAIEPRLWKRAKPDPKLRPVRAALAAAAKQAAPRGELDELLYAIYECPDDTARRLVYADALLERGDVRGELITLQCQEALSSAQQRRERALVKEHGITWLGELAPVIRTGFRFERGFLAACTVSSDKRARIERLIGHPAWSTVHSLADSARIALDPVMRSLRTLVFRPNHAREREGFDDAMRELLAGRSRSIECLTLTDLDTCGDFDEQIALLGRAAALPRLRELNVGGVAAGYIGRLLRAPVAARLAVIGVVHERYDDVDSVRYHEALRDAKVPRLVVRHPEMTMCLDRLGPDAHRVSFEQHSRAITQTLQMIGALPATVRELRIATAPETDRGALVALATATRAMPSLEVRRIG
jgi:uncharacterized protein (TIGR02996 family)